MTLRYPWLLLLLIAIPALIFLRYRRRRKSTLMFSDGRVLARLPASLAVLAQPVLPLLYAAGLSLLICALARPQRGLEESVLRTEAVDIVLLVDVSTSMLAEDFSAAGERLNRLQAAKKVMERFIAKRTNDRIGMVAFAALPYSVAPLTLDHDWLIERMHVEGFKPGMVEDGTAIGTAIGSAVNRLRESEAKSKVVILLTDGVNNAGAVSPENAAQAAKALDIKVYTVGAGTSGWVRMPVDDPVFGRRYVRQRSNIDEATLKRIADITGAEYFRAGDFDALERVYAQIDEMEKTEIEVEQFTRFEEAFALFLAWGIACLALEKLLSLTRLGRLP